MKNFYQGGEIRKPHIPKSPPPDDPVVDLLIVVLLAIPALSILLAALRHILTF